MESEKPPATKPRDASPGPLGRWAVREFGTKTFVSGLGDLALRGGQALVALSGLDVFLKKGALENPELNALAFILGCAAAIGGLYLKSKGERL